MQFNHSDLRVSVYIRFEQWEKTKQLVGGQPPSMSRYLHWLLRGTHHLFKVQMKLTEDEIDICNALLGPHGYLRRGK